MSTFYSFGATCPSCGHGWSVQVVEGIHITRLPQARQQILDGTFQVFACPSCATSTVIEASVVYTDFARGHYVAVESAARDDWQSAELRHRTVFDDCFTHGPPIAEELGRKLQRRVVFGFRALREKLMLWDAGLDDYVVEALKGDLCERLGASPQDTVLRLAEILDGGHLLFARFAPMPRPGARDGKPFATVMPAAGDWRIVTAEQYQRRFAARADVGARFPWLKDDWFVDIHGGPSYLYA